MKLPDLKMVARQILGERWFYRLGYPYLLAQADFRASLAGLRSYKDRFAGRRCFILGNGPSLRDMDLSPLANEFTFGLNRIYLLFDRLGWKPSFYVAVNKLVLEQCSAEILRQVPGPKFISWDARRWMKGAPQAPGEVLFLLGREGPRFYTDITRGVWQGGTVTFVALQIAYYLGFEQAILVGVDHTYSLTGSPHAVVTSSGEDADHFDPRYFGKGFRWQLPDLAQSEEAYRLARSTYRRAGREILDATVGGRLQVFPKVDYRSLFGERE